MLYNYLKIASRNLLKHKFFSVLNITGLALGMAACLTMILIIRDQLSYDHFHQNANRIYRINSLEANGKRVATIPEPIAGVLEDDFGVTESTVRLVRNLYGVDATTSSNLTLPLSGFYTDPSFFEIFGFQLSSGNPQTALNAPNSIVLSEETASRFFGNSDPIGQVLKLKDRGEFKVTGVVESAPGKTHLNFESLVSVATLELGSQSGDGGILGNWNNHFDTYVYTLLSDGKSISELNNALTTIGENRALIEEELRPLTFEAQKLATITPRRGNISNDLGGGAMFLIWGLLAFVIILTIFPCINYANLAIARILSRTKEVGVRKVIGAKAKDVRQMIIGEAILTALIALALGWIFHLPLVNLIENYFPPEAKMTNLEPTYIDWAIFGVYALLVGLLAGWFPARRAAKLEPALALLGNKSGEIRTSRFSWRKIMIAAQFVISLTFVIVVVTMWQQMNYMTLADYGFEDENLLIVPLKGNDGELIATEFAKSPHVKGVSPTSVILASGSHQHMQVNVQPGTEAFDVFTSYVDEHFIPVMGMNLIAGENFIKNPPESTQKYFILNEKAVAQLQLGSPEEAVGQTLWHEGQPAIIKGVVKDFHHRTFEHGIGPFVLHYQPVRYSQMIHVRLASGNPALAISSLEEIWKRVDQIHPFEAQFMDASIQRAYQHIVVFGGIIGFFALLSLSIAAMGLLGMVTYSVSTKVKEIGIRKVLGASTIGLTFLLSHQFLVLVGIASIIAIPLGYLLANQFLQLFIFRISIGALILSGSLILLLVLVVLTVGIQTFRAAVTNPVESLRNE